MRLLFRNLLLFAAALTLMVDITSCGVTSVNGKTIINDFDNDRITGSGNIVSKTLNIGSFENIKVQGMQDVVITQGSRSNVVVKGSDNLMQYNDISVQNGTLVVSQTQNKNGRSHSFRKYDMTVEITVPDLDKITSNGTGDISFRGTFNTTSITLLLNGTGDIILPALKAQILKANLNGTGDIQVSGTASNTTLNLNGTGDLISKLSNGNTLKASLTGTGDIKLSGSVISATYSATGTGDIYAKNMIAKDVTASATGTGDITCYASDSFSGNRSSITHITCYGKPADRNFKSEGYSFPD